MPIVGLSVYDYFNLRMNRSISVDDISSTRVGDVNVRKGGGC